MFIIVNSFASTAWWFALNNRRASCQFDLAHELQKTANILNGNQRRETKIEVAYCYVRHFKIEKQTVYVQLQGEAEAWGRKN